MRAPIVTDQNSPVVSVTTQISRLCHDDLVQTCKTLNVTKSEFLRLLILKELRPKKGQAHDL